MTTPSAQLAPANAADWPWLQSAIEMASLASETWPAGIGQSRVRPRALPRVATRTPALTPHSVTTARAFTLRTMLRWGAADRSHDVAGVVSELLTNAFRHALPPLNMTWPEEPGRIRLGLLSAGYVVLCAVADPSSQAPVRRQPDWLDESGRGLHLVASLSDDWGYCAVPDQRGKVVWATFTTTRRPQPDLDLGPG
jgi:anti-sigma regulatory factor (Ser/Thr protein kinase)